MSKQNHNKIPRATKTLQIELLIDTLAGKKGDVITVHKTDCGWTGQAANGTCYFFFAAMIRNANVCKVSVVE